MSALAAGSAVVGRLSFLADDTDVGDEAKKAGPIALLVIIVLCVACFLLFRSMSKHMRRVRDDFPSDPSAAPSSETVAPPTVSAGPAAPAGTSGGRSAPKSRPHAPDDPTSG